MTRIRPSRACLLFLALGAALWCAASPALAAPRRATIVRHEHIGAAACTSCGSRSSAAPPGATSSGFGSASSRAWPRRAARHRHAGVRVGLAIRGRTLTIRATAKRRHCRGSASRCVAFARSPRQAPPPHAGPQDAQRSDRTRAARGAPVGVPGSWHSIFDDEFNGTTLDTSKWSTGWLGRASPPRSTASSSSATTPPRSPSPTASSTST